MMSRKIGDFTMLRMDTLVEGYDETRLMLVIGDIPFATVGMVFQGRERAGIRQLFVIEQARRGGYGRIMVDECCRIARKEGGCQVLELLVAECNRQVIPFYEKLGFSAAPYSDGLNGTIMVKSLDGKEASVS